MLASYLQHGKLEWMMNRNQALITRLLAAAENQRSKADLVHVYDALVQNAADILKLPGVEDLEEILTKTQVGIDVYIPTCFLCSKADTLLVSSIY